MPRSSKLARRMALKKKIEEEFRLAEERAKVPKVSLYDKYWDRQDLVVVNKQDKIIEKEICIPNIKQNTSERECFQKEEPIKDDIKDITPTKDNIVEENRVLEHKIILEEKTTTDKKIENKESKRKLKKKKKHIKQLKSLSSRKLNSSRKMKLLDSIDYLTERKLNIFQRKKERKK